MKRLATVYCAIALLNGCAAVQQMDEAVSETIAGIGGRSSTCVGVEQRCTTHEKQKRTDASTTTAAEKDWSPTWAANLPPGYRLVEPKELIGHHAIISKQPDPADFVLRDTLEFERRPDEFEKQRFIEEGRPAASALVDKVRRAGSTNVCVGWRTQFGTYDFQRRALPLRLEKSHLDDAEFQPAGLDNRHNVPVALADSVKTLWIPVDAAAAEAFARSSAERDVTAIACGDFIATRGTFTTMEGAFNGGRLYRRPALVMRVEHVRAFALTGRRLGG